MNGSFQAVRGTSGFEALHFSRLSSCQDFYTQISDLVRQMDVGMSKFRK